MTTLHPDIKRFRLGIYMGDYSQPISLMRCLGPFAQMTKEEPRLELVFPLSRPEGADVSWTWLARCDAIYWSHPQSELDMSVLWLARAMGLPIWTEYVDDIFNVLPTNPHYQVVKNKRALREAVTQAIQWSDVVTSVSEICRNAFPHPERIVVIPEACLWPAWELPRKKYVTWRGLASHAGDVETVLPALCAVAKDFPEWEWGLMGDPTEEFIAQLSEAAGRKPTGEARVKVAPYFSTPFHAIQAWGGCAPYLHLVPLADNDFNKSKSCLAWLEASAIGAAVIAPDNMPTWQQPGVIHYAAGSVVHNGKQDFETVLRRELVNYPNNGKLHENVAIARKAIYPDLTLPHVNRLRWATINKLAKINSKAELNHGGTEQTERTARRSVPTFHSRSQAGQDRFVYELLVKGEAGGQPGGPSLPGKFLDIGSNDPEIINNTLALEEMGWRGLLVDLDGAWTDVTAKCRKSPFICADAAVMDWTVVLKEAGLADQTIEYVSMDVDAATLPAVQNLLEHGVKFRVATIEHDSYRFGNATRDAIRKLMAAEGYSLLCADVCLNHEHVPFEDWYVDWRVERTAFRFRSSGLSWKEVLEKGVEPLNPRNDTKEEVVK